MVSRKLILCMHGQGYKWTITTWWLNCLFLLRHALEIVDVKFWTSDLQQSMWINPRLNSIYNGKHVKKETNENAKAQQFGRIYTTCMLKSHPSVLLKVPVLKSLKWIFFKLTNRVTFHTSVIIHGEKNSKFVSLLQIIGENNVYIIDCVIK